MDRKISFSNKKKKHYNKSWPSKEYHWSLVWSYLKKVWNVEMYLMPNMYVQLIDGNTAYFIRPLSPDCKIKNLCNILDNK